MSQSHKVVPIKVNAFVDEGVAQLVEALNEHESIAVHAPAVLSGKMRATESRWQLGGSG